MTLGYQYIYVEILHDYFFKKTAHEIYMILFFVNMNGTLMQ